jgi:hypothetical protein
MCALVSHAPHLCCCCCYSCHTGLLQFAAGLLAALPATLRALLELETQRQQQQQTGDWRLFVGMLDLLRSILHNWSWVAQNNPAMLRTILPAVLPLLQHVQACGPLLPAAPTSAAASTNAARSFAVGFSSSSSSGRRGLHLSFFDMQFDAGVLLFEVLKLLDTQQSASQSELVCRLVRDPAASSLLLQLLAVHVKMLHATHVTYRQQQRQQLQQQQGVASAASLASNSGIGQAQQQESSSAPKQQLRADLLPIPAFHQHQDMLQLLPGGQAYLDAAAARAAEEQHAVNDGSRVDLLKQLATQVRIYVQALTSSVL